jgi:short-subunit dehydrogenase
VVVTGALSGIGRATAHAFAGEGASLVLVSRRASVLQEVEDEIGRYHVPSLVAPADLSSDDDLNRVVAQTMRAFNRIDVLVNNAGLGNGGALHEMQAEDLHAILQVNLHGTFRLTQAVLPIMLEQKSGHIVNVSSIAAKLCMPGLSIYSATKSAIVTFSNCLRRELAESGIRVSTLIGGITRTAITARAMNESTEKTTEARRAQRKTKVSLRKSCAKLTIGQKSCLQM